MNDGKYTNIARAVIDTPWAILPEKLAAIHELIALRLDGQRFTDVEIAARIGNRPGATPATTLAGNVAIIPLAGTIAPKADLMTEISGGTSLQTFQGQLRAALADPKVEAIVLDVDSPGGSTSMLTEMAAEIRAARGKKPIVAVANPTMASAAYHLGSQADEVVATPSAVVGSIGVYGTHQDLSGLHDQAGVKVTLISAGKHKVDGNPYEPLSDDARATIQGRIDESFATMTRDIAAGRKTPIDNVRNGYGQGKVLTAKSALAEGMVDRVDTLEATVQRVSRAATLQRSGRASQAPPGQVADAQIEGAEGALFVAPIGATLTDEADALLAGADHLSIRVSSLAEVRRGSLTGAKREALAACSAGLRDAATQLDELVAATDPDKARNEGAQALAALLLDQLQATTS